MVANTGVPMKLEGWKYPVVVDLSGLKIPSQSRPVRHQHDARSGVGHTDSIAVHENKLLASGVVSRDTVAAREVVASSKNGFPWHASMGANPDKTEFVKPGQDVTVNGQRFSGPLNVVTESTLGEISFVDLGADGNTSVRVAAMATVDENVEDVGTIEATGDESASQVITRAKAERKRQQAIRAEVEDALNIRGADIDEIERISAQAIDEGWPLEKAQIAFLRATRPRAPHPSRREEPLQQGVIEAAVCLSGGLRNPEKHFDEATLNAADKKYPHGLGLIDTLRLVARENGVTVNSAGDLRSLLQGAFGMGIQASGFSTISIAGILGATANKFLAEGFAAVESAWRSVARIRSARDFKTNSYYSLTGGTKYEKVGPGGEIKHATLAEQSYTAKADTYGKMLGISREHLINDDLSALTELPMLLGRGAGDALNEVFWTEFLADLNTFYTSGRGNVSTGAGSALSSAGLQAALLKFRKQTDPDSRPLGLTPRILLVPPELEVTAEELILSSGINTGGAATDTKVPNRNIWVAKYQVVTSTFLSNSTFTGYSTTAWWLIADPMQLPLIAVLFLNGREAPIIETVEPSVDRLGIGMRAYHDFGVKKQEYRAAVRSAGS